MKYSIKKNICRAVLVGILVSLLPVYVKVQASQVPVTQQKTMQFSQLGSKVPIRLPRRTIDKYLRQIDKSSHLLTDFTNKINSSIKKIKEKFPGLLEVLNTISNIGGLAAMIGGAVIGITTEAATLSLVGVNILMLPAHIINFIFISVGVGGILALIGGINYGLAISYMNRLKKEEKLFPGTLTVADLEIIKVFKNVLKGPVARSLLRKDRLNRAMNDAIQDIIKSNKNFVAKDLKKYILAKIRIPGAGKALYPLNLNITWYNYLKYMDIKITWEVIGAYNTKKKKVTTQDELNKIMRDQIQYMKGLYDKMSKTKRFFKRLTAGYHALNAKEFSLKIKPKYAFAQNALNSDMKTVKKLDAKYGSSFANKIQPAIESYKKEMQKILSELSVERKEIVPPPAAQQIMPQVAPQIR